MPDLINNGWTIARSALLTHQQRLTVTSNNIANINTPGYTRRVVQLATVQETPSSIHETRDYSHGVGVRVADVVRAQSSALQGLLRQQTGDTSGHDTRASGLANLESLLLAGDDSSLNTKLDAFWNSWYDLSNQAENMDLRVVVVQRGADLAATLNSLHGRIDSFEQQVIAGMPGSFTGQLPSEVDQFNQLTTELQDLNARISYSLSSFEPQGLMDRREVVLGELAALADIQVGTDYSVTLDGQTVVSANGGTRAVLDVTAGGPPATFELDGTAVSIASGAIGAWSDVLDIAAGMSDRLDTLAVDLMNAVNDIHNSDRNLAGDTYDLLGVRCDWDFFSGTGAADIAVNASIYNPADPLNMDASLVAAASSRHEDGPPPVPNPGDGSIALQIADLAGESRSALGGLNFGDYHTTGLTMLGGLIQSEQYLAEDGQAIADALENALQAEIGVNMDEELMNMLQAQRAYESAARVLSTIDEMIQTILQL
ncbi:MAG: flagellar hook-associated protein FlgK [Lentisphaerae bacterium]|nr:flagellar hook-associated protein FlgK [Lentisphaerota bacterium]